MKSRIIILFLITLFLASCIKPPQYSDIPYLEFVSVNKTTFNSGDSIKITIYFEDGNGDIGGDITDSLNLFFGDSRVSPYYFGVKIPYVQLQGNHDDISGNIYFTYNTTCINPVLVDSFTYNIYMLDRAGNKSNIISTPQMAVSCN